MNYEKERIMVNDLAIESTNFLLAFTAIYGAWMAIRWKIRNHISPETSAIVFAWSLIFLSVGIRAGWFALSRDLSDNGSHWNSIMFEYRYILVILTAAMFCWGMFSFIRHIEEVSIKAQGWIFSGLIAISLVWGYF